MPLYEDCGLFTLNRKPYSKDIPDPNNLPYKKCNMWWGGERVSDVEELCAITKMNGKIIDDVCYSANELRLKLKEEREEEARLIAEEERRIALDIATKKMQRLEPSGGIWGEPRIAGEKFSFDDDQYPNRFYLDENFCLKDADTDKFCNTNSSTKKVTCSSDTCTQPHFSMEVDTDEVGVVLKNNFKYCRVDKTYWYYENRWEVNGLKCDKNEPSYTYIR